MALSFVNMNCPICQAPFKRPPRAGRLAVCDRCGKVVSSVANPPVQNPASDEKIVDAEHVAAPVTYWDAAAEERLKEEIFDELVKPPPAWAISALSCASLFGVACWLAFRSVRNIPIQDDLALLLCNELGILFFCVGFFNWKWWWKFRKPRNLRRLLGPTVARRSYMVLGALTYIMTVYNFCFGGR